MAKKPPAKSRTTKQRTKPGVPGEAGNKNRSRRAAKAAGQAETLPGIGHNGPPANGKPPPEKTLSEKERKALLIQHVGDYKKLIERLKKVTADIKNFGKLAKAEGGKTQMKRIKAYIALETPEGEAAIREEMADVLEVAKWIGSPVGTQFTFDVDEPDRTPAVERAFTEGENDALGGKVASPGYDPGVPQYQHYMSGYHSGQAILLGKHIKAPEPPEPEASGPVEADDAERSAEERKLSNAQLGETEQA